MKRIGFIAFLLAVASLTAVAYRLCHPEWVIYRKAETLFSNHAYARALPLYEELRKRGFDASGLLRNLGSAYLAAGKEHEARAVFEEMMARGEDRLGVMKELALLYVGTGRFEEAAVLFRAVLQQDPDDRSVRIRLARILFWTGRNEEAIHEYRKALGEGI